MAVHYSQPKGFVGRTLAYAVVYDGVYYGHIVAGSATLHLPGRNEYLGVSKANLRHIVSNTFFSVSPANGRYPVRNFTSAVVRDWMERAAADWQAKYGDTVQGFETLVELPRTGELYRRAGFVEVGTTIGYSCKRTADPDGIGTDSWSGRRIWNMDEEDLRPKVVLCRKWESKIDVIPVGHQFTMFS